MELKIHDQELRLQKLWKTKALIKRNLSTLDGHNLVVLYAGRLNYDAGPDFRDAVVKINGRLLRGDIEVHLESAGWWQHGHDRDPAYNNVILHLVSQESLPHCPIRREDGVEIPEVNLRAQLGDEDAAISGTHEPHRSEEVVEDCPLSRESDDRIELAIIHASERWFQDKLEQLSEQIQDQAWDQVVYAKILEALGYSKNQLPFRRLAELVPYSLLVSEMQWVDAEMAEKKCAALLFGAAGLLPSQAQNISTIYENLFDSHYISSLEYIWDHLSHQLQLKPMMAHDWKFFRLRPLNFPTRRLAGMVQLMRRFYYSGLLSSFIKIIDSDEKSSRRLAGELERCLSVPFYGPSEIEPAETGSVAKGTALIGKHRAREIAINIVIPAIYLYCRETDAGLTANKIRELYFKFPSLSPNVISKKMTAQLFRHGLSRNRFAFRQQGMIHLNLYCKALRCAECLEKIGQKV